ncbi:hypothetical protein [Chondromyces crocatus]|uniref:Uncharacterized protein n=1 Tax=Chondromyces crocatus TaxID=52 RepID=A0A0K1E941_CHOCO|nr:hypothetical protein [Chondromyces crocatus]AKT37192.1 uncharacterized protein CMC5_013220 [Chondromyces crocatus]
MSQDQTFLTASSVDWTDLQQYLASRGWTRARSRRDDVDIFRHEGREVLVPLDRSLADYEEAIATAAERIASAEARSPEAVLADLTCPRADRVRVGRTDEGSEEGTLGLLDGASLLAGVRRALLASACSVERPDARFHPRMTLKSAEAFVDRCRLGQTERGSFVLTLLCPLDAPPVDDPMAPFARRAVAQLLNSIYRAVALLRQGERERLLDGPEPPVITANLCEALVEMMPADQRGDLWVGASWSPLVNPPQIPSRVQVDRALFPMFEDLSQRLRPPSAPRQDRFVGKVIELRGEANEHGALEGEVVLLLQVGEELIRTRCTLDPTGYEKAIEAHKRQRYLSLRGLLQRRPKSSTIEKPADIQMLT